MNQSDEELWEAFVSASVSDDEWTHRAHVRVAFMHLQRFPFQEALDLVRVRIQALNQQHGTPEALDRGYHETVTRAFLQLIAASSHESNYTCSDEFCDQHPKLLDKRVLLNYYSRDRLMSAEAKASFVAPDLQPLPELAD